MRGDVGGVLNLNWYLNSVCLTLTVITYIRGEVKSTSAIYILLLSVAVSDSVSNVVIPRKFPKQIKTF